jgi:hypothetical protein
MKTVSKATMFILMIMLFGMAQIAESATLSLDIPATGQPGKTITGKIGFADAAGVKAFKLLINYSSGSLLVSDPTKFTRDVSYYPSALVGGVEANFYDDFATNKITLVGLYPKDISGSANVGSIVFTVNANAAIDDTQVVSLGGEIYDQNGKVITLISVSKTLTISDNNPVLSVNPTSRSVAKTAGTTSFGISNTGTGTMPWTAAVTTGGSWLSITSGASGSNAGTITCSFNANTGSSARTGVIRVTAAGATGSPKDVTVTQAEPLAGGGSLAVSFAGSGLWVYNSDSATWTQISSINPENMIYSGSTLYGDFGALGLWQWDGAVWSQLTSADPENMVTSSSILYVDFGASYGLYKWDGAVWSQLTTANPENMVTSGSILYVDFGASYGLYKWDGAAWSQLTKADPENMVTSDSTLYVDFGASFGLYKWDGASWGQLTSANPEGMVTSGSTIYVDFGALGLYKWDGAAWSQLTKADPENMVTSDLTLYVDFGAFYGLYKWDGSMWTLLTSSDPENIVTLGSTLYGDFGIYGFWKWNGSSWSQVNGFNPLKMVVSN